MSGGEPVLKEAALRPGSTWVYRLLALLFVGLFSIWWFHRLRVPLHSPLDFDDAYMFYRYAMNVRHGLGVSWNLDGAHTYGQTSPLWGFVVLLLSFLPLSVSKLMMLGSWGFSVLALIATTWAVVINAKSVVMKKFCWVFLLVALPVASTVIYSWHATTGMESMLAVTLGGVFAGLTLLWGSGRVRPEVVGVVGLLLFLTRPESALIVVLSPGLLFVLSRRESKKGIATLLGVFFVGAALELFVCKLYFHSALPLSFLMKSQHGYEGYANKWHPVASAYELLSALRFYLIGLAFLVRRTEWKMVFAMIVPTLLTFAYLMTVLQIMGFHSRFYLPYLPFLVVPALVVLDRRIEDLRSGWTQQWNLRTTAIHVVVAVAVAFCCHGVVPNRIASAADAYLQSRTPIYDAPVVTTASGAILPKRPYLAVMWGLTDMVMTQLPRGTSMAASEVGYLGGHALQSNIIDLAGLNDNDIAFHGFHMDELLKRKPDLIWLPHWDYSYQRGVMLSDPALLQQYDVYAGAANYGLAVRKDSAVRPQIDQQLRKLWGQLYPGYVMSDYLVSSVSWTGKKHEAVGEQ